jgi:hypothetical protein
MLASFSAHKNGVSQGGCPNLLYVPVTFSAVEFDNGCLFDTTNSWWKPPAGLVLLSANVWINAGAKYLDNYPGDGYSQCAKFHRSPDNGVTWEQVRANPGWNPAGYPSTGGSTMCTVAMASGTDLFQLRMYTTSQDGGSSCVIDGNPAHTWFSGALLCPSDGTQGS